MARTFGRKNIYRVMILWYMYFPVSTLGPPPQLAAGPAVAYFDEKWWLLKVIVEIKRHERNRHPNFLAH